MSDYCKGCGIQLQDTDSKALGYAPRLDADYCQRCYKLRHYGQVTINMQQGIATNKTLEKINDLDGVVFWTVDLFNLESNLISRLNQKLPGKKIVMILTKRDVLPATLTDEKIKAYVQNRLKQEGIAVEDIVIAGYLTSEGARAREVVENLEEVVEEHAHGENVIFMGSANAGKSTLVNKLLGSKELTISRHPGTTLDIISRPWKERTLYDTPGLEDAHSALAWLEGEDLKTVIPVKPLKPYVSQVYEDQSFAIGGLARLDIVTSGKASIVGYFALTMPIHRGKLSDADRLWHDHLGEMLSPTLDTSLEAMKTWNAPAVKPGQKLDVVIHGVGWFCVSGDISKLTVKTHQGIYVTFRKAMI